MTTPVERFVEQAAEIPGVDTIETDASRYPPRVLVGVPDSRIPPAVHDVIDHHNARIVDAEIRPSNRHLDIVVAVPERWKDGGPRMVRAIGSSTGLTLPPEALDASGFAEGTKVDAHARPGELHLRTHNDGPRLP